MTRNQRLAACAFAITTPLLALTACDDGFQPIDARHDDAGSATAPGDIAAHQGDADPAPEAATSPRKPAPPQAEPPAPELAAGDDPLALPAPEDRDQLSLDYGFKDQDGNDATLADFKGKPILASFIFTKCPNPNMCPLVGARVTGLQYAAKREGLSDDVWLLLISFDLNYDTPERLKEWGQNLGIQFTNARMLLPDLATFPDFVREYQLRIGAGSDGQLTHKLDTFMLDHEGRLVQVIQGQWSSTQVYDALKKLVEEQKATG